MFISKCLELRITYLMAWDHRRIKSHWIQPFPIHLETISEFSSFKSFDKETVTEIFLDFPLPIDWGYLYHPWPTAIDLFPVKAIASTLSILEPNTVAQEINYCQFRDIFIGHVYLFTVSWIFCPGYKGLPYSTIVFMPPSRTSCLSLSTTDFQTGWPFPGGLSCVQWNGSTLVSIC